MASASGGQSVSFELKLLVSDQHNTTDNLRIIQRIFQQKHDELRRYLNDKYDSVHLRRVYLREETTTNTNPIILLELGVTSFEEMEDIGSIVGGSKLASAFTNFASKIEMFQHVTPQDGLKFIIHLPKELLSDVKSKLPEPDQYGCTQKENEKDKSSPLEAYSQKGGNVKGMDRLSKKEQKTETHNYKQTRNDQAKGDQIKKSFVVFVPNSGKRYIGEVKIVCERLPSLDDVKLYKKFKKLDLYFCEVSLPASVLGQGLKYKYQVCHSYSSWTYRLSDCLVSDYYRLESTPFQRDVWSGFEFGSVREHLISIVYHEQYRNLDLKDNIIQIETFLERFKFDSTSIKDIIQFLTEKLQDNHKKEAISCLVIIGYISQRSFYNRIVMEQEKASMMLKRINQYEITDFPSSCKTYLPGVCQYLCDIIDGCKASILTKMARCQPFLDEHFFNTWIQKSNKKEMALTDDSNIEAVEKLVKCALHKIKNKGLTEEITTFLKSLMNHCALQVSYNICKLLQSGSTEEHGLLQDAVETLLDKILISLKTSDVTENFIKLWDIILGTGYLLDRFKGRIEKEIIKLLQTDRYLAQMLTIIQLAKLFDTEERQLELLKTISESNNPEIHSNFHLVISLPKFEDCLHVGNLEIFQIWFKTLLDKHLPRFEKDRLITVYRKTFQVISAVNTNVKDRIGQKLDELVYLYISSLRITDVLISLGEIESLCMEPSYLTMCENHLMKFLNSKRRQLSMQESLKYLTTLMKSCMIDSRLVAMVVCALLEDCSVFLDSDSVLTCVEKMTTAIDVWKPIFSCYGMKSDIVKDCVTYKRGEQAVTIFMEKLQKLDIPHEVLKNENHLKIKGLLLKGNKSTHVYQYEIEKLWAENLDKLKQQKKELENLFQVTYAIKKEIKDRLPKGFDYYHNQICNLVEHFDKMYPSDVQSKLNDLINNQNILYQCQISAELVKSKVYWNLYRIEFDSSDILSDLVDSIDNEENIIMDVCHLFEEISIETPSDNMLCTRFVRSVLENGNKVYLKEWVNLQESTNLEMNYVFAMFLGCFLNINEEIKFAETFLRRRISESCHCTLIRLSKLEKMIGTVDAMESTVKAFKIDLKKDQDFDKAISSFRKLLCETKIDLSFQQISLQLRVVYDVSEKWNECTVNVLKAIGKASSLIVFLTEIMNEDIRNLIDAVEDISEQHVSESTVSALIEAKRFFKPLIDTPRDKCVEMLNHIHHQVERFGENAKMLPSKIDDCMDNLHNLKSLYNNVANRGEQTKQVIQNIVKQGKFHFQLDAKHKHCDFTVTYTQQKTKQEQRHTKAALSDFRSRALLLMNSERQSKNTHDLEEFVKAIDRCLDISEIIYQLYSAGHWKYPNYKVTKPLSQLVVIHRLLGEDLESWRYDHTEIRKTYYLMNFVQGLHIHVIYRYLEKNEEDKLVDIVLRFIHPELKSFDMKECYDQMKNNFSTIDFLTLIGEAITICHSKLKFFSRHVKTVDDKEKRITEIVKSGRVQIVHLEEDTAIKTLLALYLRTSSRLPEPSEVLLCTRDTTWSEIELLLGRCTGAYKFFNADKLFCIANVELLSNEILFKLVDILKNIDKRSEFLLAIICRGSGNHSLLDEFYENVIKIRPLTDETVKLMFEEVCPDVCTYTSDRAGLGKSTTILSTAKKNKTYVKSIHVSGQVQKQKLIERCHRIKMKCSDLLHIDIGYIDHSVELDTFLFELIILGFTAAEGAVIDLRTTHICIEIANTINNTLRDSLQTAVLFKRKHLKWHDHCDFVVSKEVNSPVQIVCHYLMCLDKDSTDRCDLVFSGEGCVKPLSTKVCRYLLQKYFVANDTFTATNICIRVLADQLKKMSNSTFFKVSRIRDMIGNKKQPKVKSSMVKALYEVTKELTYRSVDAYRNTQQNTLTSGSIVDDSHVKVDLAAAAASKYTEHMIRWEESNHLIYVFHNQNIQTISPMYRVKSLVPDHIKDLFESQMKRRLSDFQKLSPNDLQDILQKVVRTNPASLPRNQLDKLSKDYALTPDNLLKMILIILRIKSRVPVLVMGETGCGKTSLIRYLATICEVDFDVVSIHAGVEEKTIIKRVLGNNELALANLHKERWLFLDEINTSEYIGLISDMICHHMCFGKLLSPNLVILSACNPYKLRSTKSIHTSGLKGKVKTDELSRLVYRVLPLPEILVDYVWDFGSLTEKDEKIYIDRMVAGVFRDDERTHNLYVDLLAMSQTFARSVEETTSSVSLRDIYRCKILTEWFLETLLKKSPKKEMVYKRNVLDNKIPAIILSLSHCYICRFSEKDKRRRYLKQFEHICEIHHKNIYTSELVEAIIRQEQQDILSRMELPSGTAQNTALRENVFVILVCILNRIPIFVVGKPGCSKSLSLQVIKSNLRGKDSKDEFFQTLPQLYCVSFQGSESSTSDGILKVFEKAEKYQEANNKDDVLSVVILDEIGLAEISRFNPLKVLHNLLETDGQSRPNVAVVGVSNWSLDASKMNRAIHLSRPDMDLDELFDTAKSISESFEKEEKIAIIKVMEKDKYSFRTHDIENKLQSLADSYMNYILAIRFENFHGLRDYYSLVKYIANELSVCKECPVEEQIISVMAKGLERNFGGLPTEKEMLRKKFQMKQLESSHVLELLKDNAKDPLARHLMIITTGDSALGIIEQSLNEAGRDKKEILFGSQFEEDLTDDYNYRMLSRIILCMEQGMVLILRNLESVYGSLYDMLNKNYSEIGSKKHCRVALGAYSNPICHVHDDFRCIVIVNEKDVDNTDPPFLNRFEKQIIIFSDVICAEQKEIIDEIENWIDSLCKIEGRYFEKENCFPIYSKDMIASFVMYKKIKQMDEIKTVKLDLLQIIRPECIVRLPRAISESTRIEAEWLQERYFALPLHNGISEFIKSEKGKDDNLMLIIFTNTSIHSRCLYDIPGEKQIEKLGSFKSEKQLSSRIKNFWLQSNSELLFVQCSIADDEKHIMLAKSVIERNRLDYLSNKLNQIEKHVFLIIHLDLRKNRSHSAAQINFLSGWKLAMLDSIETPSIPLPDLHKLNLHEAVLSKRPLTDYVSDQLFWAFSRIKFGKHGRNVDSIERVLKQMKHSEDFIRILEEKVCDCVSTTNEGMNNTAWQETVACDPQALETSLTFMDALEKHITHVINDPLSKIIFQLEIMGVTQSYFIEDGEYITRKRAWMTRFSNEKLFSIKGIHDENGPETYECNTHDFSLKMPFSLYIYNTIESTSEEYLRWLATLKQMCNIDEDDELPPEVLDKLEIKQRLVISQELQIDEFVYSGLKNDYVDDFCNITSFEGYNAIEKQKRIDIMKWIIKIFNNSNDSCELEFVTSLHIVFWRFSNVFHNVLNLLDVCQKDVLLGKGEFDLLEKILCEIDEHQTKTLDNMGEQTLTNENVIELYKRKQYGERNTEYDHNSSIESDKEDNTVLECVSSNVSTKDTNVEHKSSVDSNSPLEEIIENSEKFDEITEIKSTEINAKNAIVEVSEKTSDEDSSNDNTSDDEHTLGNLNCSGSEIDTEEVGTTDDKGGKFLSEMGQTEEDSQEFDESVKLEMINIENIATVEESGRSAELSYDKNDDQNDGKPDDRGGSVGGQVVENTDEACLYRSTEANTLLEENADLGIRDNKLTDDSHNEVLLQSGSQTVINDMQPLDRMIHILCKFMLPTKETLLLYKGLENWHFKVNTVLRLAANVSDHAPLLHSLRLCNDISTVLLQSNTPISIKIETIAQLLNNGKVLDSQIVFDQLIEILTDLKHDDCQQLLSIYLMRCFALNPKTDAMDYFLKAIMMRKLSSTNLTYLKLPLSTAFLSEDGLFYVDLIENPKNCEDLPPSFRSLDTCLKYLNEDYSESSEFFTLIIDIFEEKFRDIRLDEDNNDLPSLFLNSHILLKGEFGVSFLAGVAFCKVYISHFIIDDGEYTEECLETVLPAFQFMDEENVDLFLCKLLLKCFGRNKPLAKIWLHLNSLKEKFPVFGKFSWSDKDLEQCFEICPLKIYSPQAFGEAQVILVTLKDNKHLLKDLMKKGKESANNLIGIYGASAQYFYFQRLYSRMTDTKRMHASAVVEASSCLGEESACLLKCIVGQEDFDVSEFNIHKGSSSTDFYLSNILISLFCVLFAEFENSDKERSSILTRCLLKPKTVKCCFLPGMQNTLQSIKCIQDVLQKFIFHKCHCDIRVCAKKDKVCKFCLKEVSEEKEVEIKLAENIMEPKRGYIVDVSVEDSMHAKVSPVMYQMLSILTKGCIIGSVALGQATSSDLEEIGVPENGVDHLWSEIEKHWEYILGALNVSEYTLALIFHATLHKSRDFLCKDTTKMLEQSERSEWESQFKLNVEGIFSSRFISIQKLFAKHIEDNKNTLEGDLRELNDIQELFSDQRREELTDMLRFQGKVSIDNFYFEFEAYRNRYPFLDYVLQSYEELSQPPHIIPIVQWHLLVVSSVSYVMRRDECLKMTVNDFLHMPKEKNQRDHRRQRFDAFKKIWMELFKHIKDEELSSKYFPMNSQSKLSDCLILDEASVIFEVLLKLVKLQNTFLDTSLVLAQTCNSAKFLCDGPDTSFIKCVDLASISVKHLVSFDMTWKCKQKHEDDTWEGFISAYTQSNSTYGCGQHLIYNFSSIEKALAVKLLNGKAYINMKDSLPRIIFSDEFYKNFALLVSDLHGLIKQKHLPKSIKEVIQANNEKDPKMATELVKHLGVVMALMKKTSGEPNMSLIDYIDKWSTIMAHSFPHDYLPKPSNSIKLEHIVALHELLEELSANPIVDSLEDEFKQGLDADIESHMSNLIQNRFKLAEIVLGTIKRFVFRCLSVRDADPKQMLSSYIKDKSFWPVGVVSNGVIGFGEERMPVCTIIPDGLMVSHVGSTVTFLETVIQDKKQRDLNMLNMSGMAVTFNTSNVAAKAAKNKPKRTQKAAKEICNF